jgi:hypothetical protein
MDREITNEREATRSGVRYGRRRARAGLHEGGLPRRVGRDPALEPAVFSGGPGYREFQDFDPRELNLVEALRTLRLLHYSAWIAQRWEDPAFPVAFPWFNTQRYWQDRILELREQVALMDEPPLSIDS